MHKAGAFTFVLHSHLPYCRQAGRWPHGEEWLHEAAAETYLPLLNALYDLAEESTPARLTLGMTPILTEQLADPLVREHSDWPFLVTTGQARAYAIERFQSHADRFSDLADTIEANDIAAAVELAETLWERDKVFPTIDYLWFAARQGRAE